MSGSSVNLLAFMPVIVLLLLALRRIIGGAQRGSLMWIMIGVLLVVLAIMRAGALLTNVSGPPRMPGRYAPVAGGGGTSGTSEGTTATQSPRWNPFDSTPSESAASPAAKTAKRQGRDDCFRDGWVGAYENAAGVVATITVLPPDS